MAELLNHIFSTPYIWSSLGMITALSVFIGPLLYNGDLTLVTKSLIGTTVFLVFAINLFTSHVIFVEKIGYPMSLQPAIFLLMLAISYAIGIFIGVLIFKLIHKK